MLEHLVGARGWLCSRGLTRDQNQDRPQDVFVEETVVTLFKLFFHIRVPYDLDRDI